MVLRMKKERSEGRLLQMNVHGKRTSSFSFLRCGFQKQLCAWLSVITGNAMDGSGLRQRWYRGDDLEGDLWTFCDAVAAAI